MIILLSCLLGVVSLLIFLTMRRFKYWERKNVPTGKIVPLFGDSYEAFMGQASPDQMILKLYNKVPSEHRYVGAYMFHVPVLVARTPDMIKQLCVKDWEHFADHGNIILNSTADKIWQRAIFPSKGQEWKEARRLTSPVVNGNKVKLLFPVVVRHAEKFVQFMQAKKQEVVEIEAKDCILRLLNDIAWDTALGMEVDSFKYPRNLAYDVGTTTVSMNTQYKKIVLTLNMLCEEIPKFLGLTLFSEGESFFMDAIKDTLKMRKEKGIQRPDLIGNLIEEELKLQADKEKDYKKLEALTEEAMASYIFVMYLAMTDTINSTLPFLPWELAMAPEIQEKLRQECDGISSEDGDVTYQDIIDMKYMDMVINELLRKWPGAIASDRLVTKPYTIEPELPHEKPVHLEVGDNIFIPIYAIHRDPQYFENPDIFDPERFSPENKHKMDSNAFIPFGVGPRFCAGTRLSVIVMKVIAYHLVRAFEIVPVDKTPYHLVMDKDYLNLYPVGGISLGLKARK